MSELLRVENISYHYDNNYIALKNASVTFHTGEIVAVLGSNGAGKSTFFLCCNGVLRPQSGKIYYRGEEISKSKKDIYKLRQAVGLVFQDPDSQIIAGSVESEVSFGPMNLRLPHDEVSRRVEEALAQMDISRYKDYAPHYLSGGEKKRVSIADILAMQPEMILLDEPTASLDPQNADVLEQIIRDLNRKGITIVISTHDVNFAYRVAGRTIVFMRGEIIADASVDEVFAQAEALELAGLKKPLLYEAFECMQANFPNMQGKRKPRTVEEFQAFVKGGVHV
ncbi:MAG: ATP-binding cassette domain-containing protein [Oscillospiraceae bacterium]|nr:ATP-binding cassette domain-containing protein [Oscillospiraceae bacterium]